MTLLVIGDVATDVVALHSGPLLTGTDTEADITLRPGGSAANTAAWAAHLGADTRLLARVGRDTASWHVEALEKAGVTACLRVDEERPTAVVISMVDPSGERSFLTNRGAARELGPGDWSDDLLDGVAHVHLSGYLFFSRPGLELARRVLAAARGETAAGSRPPIPVSVDPASTGFLETFGPRAFLSESAGASLVIPNLAEALLLTGARSAEAAAITLSLGYGRAAVKLGANGALLAEDGTIIARAEGGTGPVVDSTGAGDAFAAGFLAAKVAGGSDSECLSAGCAAGAEAVRSVGGRPPVPAAIAELYPIDTNW